ncbi:DUF2971 domain-containing protein [Vibrio cholerae]|uniref:DUF2971 domain-containing protein n=1 Tax=Vibrio cholerae TaxID=666 RepID=UPI0010FD76C3|nr:DUF2971 domain-containing protein [Vibrio cholerae]EGR0541746.1 DUF2971 domain-containing protein [Vibrio cholerae]EJL6677303.1 DUF2971 domain-containing protein [Vibrio cholerae]EKF9445332.1 DUF2971 domain-containing protein [Vibrio cholerae]ELM0317287.1 DUF2971 domain-containing protein [Vibrio cholerae]MBJ6934251.1 DUF2971 domain-containing protein [Vibrio cholerae]
MKNPEITSLYKYKPMNQFTLDIIASERIYYALPESFNDPFDTQCSFMKSTAIVPSTDADKVARAFPDDPEIVPFELKNVSSDIDVFQGKLKNFGIVSLAESAADILMWSHYADNHKGICIELERNENNALGNPDETNKVKYTQSYPSLSSKVLLDSDQFNSSLKRVLYTKSKQWEYEKEWRTFKPQGGKVYPLPGKIKSVTFGARSSQMDIEIVKKLIAGTDIKLFQAELKQNDFGIKSRKIT